MAKKLPEPGSSSPKDNSLLTRPYRIGIIGASGYTGLELIRLISSHPHLEICYLTSESKAGEKARICFPFLPSSVDLVFQRLDLEKAVQTADIFFLATPNGLALKLVPYLRSLGKRVIDLSADYRFNDLGLYQRIYGQEHHDIEVAREAVYGLTELNRSSICSTLLVANPGCYATSLILGLAPILNAGLNEVNRPIIADAKSGLSGAGRKAEYTYLFTECDQNLKPYNIGIHRHTPEVEAVLAKTTGQIISLLFCPQIVPLRRGILSNLYIPLAQPDLSFEYIYALYENFYRGEPFIQLASPGSIPCLKEVYLSNYCRLGLVLDQRTKTLIVISVLDNLLKGAAGQALQNCNLMLGLDERCGLPMTVPFP